MHIEMATNFVEDVKGELNECVANIGDISHDINKPILAFLWFYP